MEQSTPPYLNFRVTRVGWTVIAFWALQGCGAVGSPLPPEKIGIEAKVRQQRALEESAGSADPKIIPIGESEVVLPPLQPVGTN